MRKKCIGTQRDKESCEVEKYGCEGCNYYKEEEKNEQKTSECANDKSNKTD